MEETTAHYYVKETNLKRLHTAWFQLRQNCKKIVSSVVARGGTSRWDTGFLDQNVLYDIVVVESAYWEKAHTAKWPKAEEFERDIAKDKEPTD